MSYLVIARKYRPQVFEEVIGQEAIAATLANAISSDRVAQAYLFSGTRGVGKTTMARILAKALNCPKAKKSTPCNKCDSCRTIMAGDNTDVVEIDGASNNSVDNIRDLRENVKYAPLVGRYKIYVIDEVHMLSKSAFNALLKTLEEPPPHVKFIFATTEPHHVPETIHSRCQRFDFRAVPAVKIRALLGKISTAEGAKIEPRVLEAIARRASGSVRDAESYLDQLLAYRPKKAVYKDYLEVFGLTAEEELVAWLGACAEGRPADAIKLVDAMADQGAETAQLALQMADVLRGALLAANGLEAPQEGLADIAGKTGCDWVLYALQVVQAALRDMRLGADGRLSLEMATARIASIGDMVSLDEIYGRLKALAVSGSAPSRPPASSPKRDARGAPRPEPGDSPAPGAQPASRWDALIADVGKSSRMLSSMLAHGRVLEVGDETLTVGFELTTHWEQAQESFGALQKSTRRVYGLDLAIVQVEPPSDSKRTDGGAKRGKARSEDIERVRKTFDGIVVREQ